MTDNTLAKRKRKKDKRKDNGIQFMKYYISAVSWNITSILYWINIMCDNHVASLKSVIYLSKTKYIYQRMTPFCFLNKAPCVVVIQAFIPRDYYLC